MIFETTSPPQERTTDITDVIYFFPQLRLRGIIDQQIAQLKELFDGET